MVNATEWINQNYPVNGTCQRVEDKENYGKTRSQITELDVSNQNLEGIFNIDGFRLKKLNCSFNKLNNYLIDFTHIEEIDFSHNQLMLSFGISLRWTPRFQKVNLSHNSIASFINREVPGLTHLDVSNNLLTNLDVWGTRDLVELNCSGNPFLTNFSFSSLSNLKSFDCLGVKFTKSDNIVSPTSTALATATVYTDNPALFSNTIGLGIYSGISTLGWLALAFVFFYKRFWWKAFIPTPGS